MLLVRGEPGDRDRALELLAEGVSTYRELGMETWAQAATAAARLQNGDRRT